MKDTSASFGTSISTADESSITIRGRDLTSELVGEYDFGSFLYLLVTGEEPTASEGRLCNAMVVTIAEHGMTPSVIAARQTYAAAPEAVQGAVSSGILGAGDTLLGSMESVAEMVQDGVRRVEDGESYETIAARIVDERETLPGFGHPSHEPTDPRTDRLFELLEAEGRADKHHTMITQIQTAAEAEYDTTLLINATGAIGTVVSELGMDPLAARGIALVARAGGLTAHLVEEKNDPVAWDIWSLVEERTQYREPDSSSR